ncbi:DUF397 domain-containing protein [Actinophytocola sp.]|uniref:DUF397 domain-containing protein n=1 Tax=Actinophytocola sp. TaxID=1872138 RepID=UPI00389A20FB
MSDLAQAVWRKSSRSGSANECVEVAFGAGVTALRDSKNPDGGVLILPSSAWHAFQSKTASDR